MSTTESLRDIYLEVAGEETITERQEEDTLRAPIGRGETELEEEVTQALREDGLDDAVEGMETAAPEPS